QQVLVPPVEYASVRGVAQRSSDERPTVPLALPDSSLRRSFQAASSHPALPREPADAAVAKPGPGWQAAAMLRARACGKPYTGCPAVARPARPRAPGDPVRCLPRCPVAAAPQG